MRGSTDWEGAARFPPWWKREDLAAGREGGGVRPSASEASSERGERSSECESLPVAWGVGERPVLRREKMELTATLIGDLDLRRGDPVVS